MTKVVYNACFGGFSLSEKAIQAYNKLSGNNNKYYYSDTCRHDPLLVQVVESLGKDANGSCADLRIAVIEGNLYRVDEYDGSEQIETPDSYDWVDVKAKPPA